MGRFATREEYAQFNKEGRIGLYRIFTFWAALGAMAPMACFINNNVLNARGPVSRTFTGFEHSQYPAGGSRETYDYYYASGEDLAVDIFGFFLGIFAGAAVALLFYCLARFVADPIMYRIDLHTEMDSRLQYWPKRIVMVIVVLLYCASMVFALEYEQQYVWVPDGHGNEVRMSKEDYEKYRNGIEADTERDRNERTDNNSDATTDATEETEESTTSETEDLSKTPVERGYPSNDLEYYIDHPDEPMPQELIEELMPTDLYGPGKQYEP